MIADGITLPADAVTGTWAIIARRGAGKTFTAKVKAEELLDTGAQIVVLDPTGAWWGLRSTADGNADGYPVTILGGAHGDLPLEPAAGALIADLVTDTRASIIIDLSWLDTKAEQNRFVTAFAERLYRAKAKQPSPLHVFVDEADEMAPQRPLPGEQRMLGAWQSIVRRGRSRGLGVTLITQRPAVLNKDVLTQAEGVTVLQITGPQDRKAIDDWVSGHATKEERALVFGSLAALGTGEAWWWCPSWLPSPVRAKARPLRTYDSSATPVSTTPDGVTLPVCLAAVDIAALGEAMAATVERAERDDPKRLHARIAELERALAATPAPVTEYVEVIPEQAVAALGATRKLLTDLGAYLDTALVPLATQFVALGDIIEERDRQIADVLLLATGTRPSSPTVAVTSPQSPRPTVHRPAPIAPVDRKQGDGVPLSKAMRAVLTVIAQAGPLPSKQVAIRAGYSPGTGGINNAISALRTAGYIERGEPITPTDDGLNAAMPYTPLPVGRDLLEWWKGQGKTINGKAGRAVLEVLGDAHPMALPIAEVATRAGYTPGTGGINNAISRLKTLGLIFATAGRLELDRSLT